ncbi:MAG: DUF4130 domain-containing protein [Clostridia bacterium]|nr:DUF4130 domain-containing protein [Clostridia bacterium]
MTAFNVEKSLDGLFSALYVSFVNKVIPDRFYCDNHPIKRYGVKVIDVCVDEQHSKRVGNALLGYGGRQLIDKISNCLLSEDERALGVSFFVCYNTLFYRKDLSRNTELEKVMQFLCIEDKVVREKNRLIRTLEFNESDGGILYASISPDSNISPLLAPYYYRKYSKLPFILHDLKRGSIVASNGYTMHVTDTELKLDLLTLSDQQQFDRLWKRCYHEILLKEKRLNKITALKRQ